MARIYGTIESLKSLKSELDVNGISRFSSIREINDFLSNYKMEKLEILNAESKKLDQEYTDACSNLKKNKQQKAQTIHDETEKRDRQIADLQKKIDSINTKSTNFLKKLLIQLKLFSKKKQLNYYVQNKYKFINAAVKPINGKIQNDELFITKYKTEKQNLIANRAKYKIQKLEHIQKILENSKNLISGAIGEHLVVKEVEKLSDDYVLINDFTLNFPRPIYHKKYKQRIYSIQIDHLLISKAGIFIIETKNWSQASVNSFSLRSPIEQIERSNYALYAFISKNISLNDHHWGEQRVPIRNLIVMIKNKPRGKFKYVSIKLLRELNNYITYFEPVLTDRQFNRIVNELV